MAHCRMYTWWGQVERLPLGWGGCSVISPTPGFGQELKLSEVPVPQQGAPALQATSVQWERGCPFPALRAPTQIGECPQPWEWVQNCLLPGPPSCTDISPTTCLCLRGSCMGHREQDSHPGCGADTLCLAVERGERAAQDVHCWELENMLCQERKASRTWLFHLRLI